MAKKLPFESGDQRPKDGKCVAHGCPLPGVVSHSTAGKGDMFCCYHAFRPFDTFQRTTAKINDNLWIQKAMERVLRIMPHVWNSKTAEIADYFSTRGRDDLSPTQGESQMIYAGRLYSAMSSACFTDESEVRQQ